jgi:hypothetical protein
MKSTSTSAGVQPRPSARMSPFTELLLCILYAAAEHLESLRPKEKTA